jgi:hypothetical protein
MTKQQESVVLVSRVARHGSSKALERVFQLSLNHAERGAERRRLTVEAMAPTWRAIESDKAASTAHSKLIELLKREDRVSKATKSNRPGMSPDFGIPPGASVFFPPYDFEKPTPGVPGQNMYGSGDPVAGTVEVECRPNLIFDGPFSISAAVGVGLTFQTAGVVGVRPLIRYEGEGFTRAAFVTGSSHGHVGFFVEAEDGPVVSAPADLSVWDMNSDNLGDYDGYFGPYSEVRFHAEAGRRYILWIWATVSGDQSGGDHVIIWGQAGGSLSLGIPMVSVQTY